MNYYNENDSFAAQWLEELIKDGLIATGKVDTRSIEDVEPNDLQDFKQCHFFAGIGGWAYAARLSGWGDDRPMWTGSPPCQPFSVAGDKKGFSDERHLWPVWFNLIRELRPSIIFGEQVSSAINEGWLDQLQADLESSDYACGAVIVPSSGVGALHRRQRLWFVVNSVSKGLEGHWQPEWLSEKKRWQIEAGYSTETGVSQPWGSGVSVDCSDGKFRTIPTEPALYPLADGIPNRMGVLRGAGNAIVPQVAAEIINLFI